MQKAFQLLLMRWCFKFGHNIFEDLNIMVQFWKIIQFALQELLPHNLHVQFAFADIQLPNPSGISSGMIAHKLIVNIAYLR